VKHDLLLTGATAVAKCQTFTVGVEFELFFKTFRQPIRQIARASVRYGYIRGLRHRQTETETEADTDTNGEAEIQVRVHAASIICATMAMAMPNKLVLPVPNYR